MRYMKCILIIITFLIFICQPVVASSADTHQPSLLKNQKLKLSLSLLKYNLNKNKKNFVVSPYSFYIIATMIANGAKNETLNKINEKILNTNDQLSLNDINDAINSEMQTLSPAIEFNNSVWSNHLKPEYIQTAINLSAEVFPLPNHTNEINEWIKNKTHNQITDILKPKIPQKTDSYLVNTIYFKDKWSFPFNKKDTKIKRFYPIQKSILPMFINMMYKENKKTPYYENDKFQAIRLTYKKGDYIDIILPKERDNIKQFINNLTLKDLDFNFQNKNVHIYLPRFETEYKFELNDYIKELNIPVFKEDKQTDLSAMCDKCYIKEIIQKAKITLDEEGTTASVATTAEVEQKLIIEEQYKVFNANHPFIYIINDGLFIGTYLIGTN